MLIARELAVSCCIQKCSFTCGHRWYDPEDKTAWSSVRCSLNDNDADNDDKNDKKGQEASVSECEFMHWTDYGYIKYLRVIHQLSAHPMLTTMYKILPSIAVTSCSAERTAVPHNQIIKPCSHNQKPAEIHNARRLVFCTYITCMWERQLWLTESRRSRRQFCRAVCCSLVSPVSYCVDQRKPCLISDSCQTQYSTTDRMKWHLTAVGLDPCAWGWQRVFMDWCQCSASLHWHRLIGFWRRRTFVYFSTTSKKELNYYRLTE